MKMDVNFPENCQRFGVELGEVTTLQGATFIPSVSEEGVLSWTNDQGLQNPAPVNIKGDPGEGGSAVLTTPQKLPEEKKAQARANIDFDSAVLDVLVSLGIAPVLLDADGAVLCDDKAIFINA